MKKNKLIASILCLFVLYAHTCNAGLTTNPKACIQGFEKIKVARTDEDSFRKARNPDSNFPIFASELGVSAGGIVGGVAGGMAAGAAAGSVAVGLGIGTGGIALAVLALISPALIGSYYMHLKKKEKKNSIKKLLIGPYHASTDPSVRKIYQKLIMDEEGRFSNLTLEKFSNNIRKWNEEGKICDDVEGKKKIFTLKKIYNLINTGDLELSELASQDTVNSLDLDETICNSSATQNTMDSTKVNSIIEKLNTIESSLKEKKLEIVDLLSASKSSKKVSKLAHSNTISQHRKKYKRDIKELEAQNSQLQKERAEVKKEIKVAFKQYFTQNPEIVASEIENFINSLDQRDGDLTNL